MSRGGLPRRIARRGDVVPWLTLYIILLYAIPSRLVVGPLGSAGAPSMLFGLLSGIAWVLVQLLRETPGEDAQPIRRALLGFLVAVSLSYVAAMTRPIDWDEISPGDVGLLSVLAWSGTLLIAHDGLRARADVETLVRRLAIAGALMALLGIAQFATGQVFVDKLTLPGLRASGDGNSFVRGGFLRAAGTATHPIEFGALLTMLLPLALHCAVSDTTRSALRRWFPVAAIAAALAVSFSRSAYIGSAIALVILFIGWPRQIRRPAAVGLAAMGAVMLVVVPHLFSTIRAMFVGVSGDPSIASRTDSYAVAWQFLERAPLFGRGLGTFLPKYRIFDNQFLVLLVSVGIIGTLAFLVLSLTAFFSLLRRRSTVSDPAGRDLRLVLAASVLAGTASLLFFDAFAFPMTMGTLFLLLGIAGATLRLWPREVPKRVTARRDATPEDSPVRKGELSRSQGLAPVSGPIVTNQTR